MNHLGNPDSPILIFADLFRYKLLRSDYNLFLNDLQHQLPNNSILIPSYTYSSRRGEVFDLEVPPDPQNGSLSRVLFEQVGIPFRRTYDVDYSYLIINPECLNGDLRLYSHCKKSFGEGSHHERIFELDPILMSIGGGFSAGFTPAMHAEALAKVPYRKYIETSIDTTDGVRREKSYFARNEDITFVTTRKYMHELFVDSSEYLTEFHEKQLVNVAVNGRYFIDQLTNTLKENPNYFIE
jgi:aminoglycoside N3'-acetyltransferase